MTRGSAGRHCLRARGWRSFRREGEREASSYRASPDERLEDAGKHSLRRTADRLGKSFPCWLRTDRRGKADREESGRALSTIRARRV